MTEQMCEGRQTKPFQCPVDTAGEGDELYGGGRYGEDTKESIVLMLECVRPIDCTIQYSILER